MSTLAIEGSEAIFSLRARGVARYADIVALVLALPLFAVADWPLLGYAAAAAAWLAQRAIQHVVERRTLAALAAGERRRAMGLTGASVLGRVWLVSLAVLVTGLAAGREDGLAAAVLAAVLFTIAFAATALSRAGGGERPA